MSSKSARTRILFIGIILGVLITQLIGCLDAAKRNIKKEKESAKQLTSRRVKISYLTQQEYNFLSDYEKNFPVSGDSIKPWKPSLVVLTKDEKRTLEILKSSLISDEPYRAITGGRELLKAGKEGLIRIIEATVEADNESSKLSSLRTLRKGIKTISLTEDERKKISGIVKKLINDESQIVATEALMIWINIITDTELGELAKYLDFPSDSVRSLIFLKLIKAKDNDVIDALLNHLNSEIVEVRSYAVNLLRFLTGKYFGYDPLGEPISRQLAVCRWVVYVFETNSIKTTKNRNR